MGEERRAVDHVSHTLFVVLLVAQRSHPGAAAPSVRRRQGRVVQADSQLLCMDAGFGPLGLKWHNPTILGATAAPELL